MKISIEYSNTHADVDQLKIDSAKYLSDYTIWIRFNDGKENRIDFKPFLSKSLHPSTKKYFDQNKFADFSLIDGNLNWNDFDLIFPVADLYHGKIG
jgi:hypothetical protein